MNGSSSGTTVVLSNTPPRATEDEEQLFSPAPSTRMVDVVSSMLSTVDASTARMQRVYVNSESKRVELADQLRSARERLSAEVTRASSAEAACETLDGSLQACEARLEESQGRLAQVSNDYQTLQVDHTKLLERCEASTKLLREFENDQDQRHMEWQHALDAAQEEGQQLKVANSELRAKGELADAWKSKFWESERQLRTKVVEVQEMAARTRVLEHRLASAATELQRATADYDIQQAKAIKAQREARTCQHELLTEQLRAKQLEGIAEMYKRRWDSAAKPTRGPVPAMSGVVEERDILREDVQRLVGRIASLEAEVQLCHERHAEDGTMLAALRNRLEEAEANQRRAMVSGSLTSLQTRPTASVSGTSIPNLSGSHTPSRSTADGGSDNRLASVEELHSTLLMCEHRNAQLELRVAEQDEEFHHVKSSSLKLAEQVETLMKSVDSAIDKQKFAESEADLCRARMTEALTQHLEAEFKQVAAEERFQFADATIVRLLSALASAEALAISSTAEVDKWRTVCHTTKLELERALHAEEAGVAQRDHLRQSANVSAAACIEARRESLIANESSSRLQLQLESFECLAQEVLLAEMLTLRLSVVTQRAFAASLDTNFQACTQRLSVLTGDFADEEMDDIVQCVRTSASNVKAAVSACDDVLHNPPVFYATFLAPPHSSLSSASITSKKHYAYNSSGTTMQWGVQSDDAWRHRSDLGYWSSTRELVVLECAFREQLAAEECAASRNMFAVVACFLGRCVDYKEQLHRTTSQLQRASECAANLFRALKVLGLKQHRRARAAHKYRELETINHTLWKRSQEIQETLWIVMDDPQVPHRSRKAIQERLDHLTFVAVPSPASDALVGSPVDAAPRGQFPSGDAFAQLKLDNEHLLEEAAKLSRQVADGDARCALLDAQLAVCERRYDNHALSASLTHLAQAVSPSAAAENNSHGVDDDAVLRLRGALTSFSVAHQRQEAVLAMHAAAYHRLLAYMENCVSDVHYIATRSVFDVCVLASFMAVLRRPIGGGGSASLVEAAHNEATLQAAKDACAAVVVAATTTSDAARRDSVLHDVGVQTTVLQHGSANSVSSVPRPHGAVDGTRPTPTRTGDDSSSVSQRSVDFVVERLMHDEETTRAMLQEHAFRVLSLHLYHAMVQSIALVHVAAERRQAELSQSHAEAEGAIHVEYKQQMMGYANAVDDCNHRLHAFMKAKSASDQECARLRSELKRAQEETVAVKRSALVHEERSGELELRFVDLEERYRHLVKDREQLNQRLASVLEHNRMLGKGFGLSAQQHLHHHTASSYSPIAGRHHHHVSVQTEDHVGLQASVCRHRVNSEPATPTLTSRGVGGSSTVASEAAAAFTPFMNDIWATHRHTPPTSTQSPSSRLLVVPRTPPPHDQSVEGANVVQQHLNQLRVHNPSVLQSATNPREAASRGYHSLAEWDDVLAKKSETFLQKEVEWSVKERQLMVLEKELDARIVATSRECVGLRFALQDARAQLQTALCIARRLLKYRRERQLHLAIAEMCMMAREDIDAAPSTHDPASHGMDRDSDELVVHAHSAAGAGAALVDASSVPASPTSSARPHVVRGWWAATKGAFTQKR